MPKSLSATALQLSFEQCFQYYLSTDNLVDILPKFERTSFEKMENEFWSSDWLDFYDIYSKYLSG